jgi:hypothetical protein
LDSNLEAVMGSRELSDLVQRLLIEEAEERLVLVVDAVEVRSVVEQALDHGWLGGLVEGGGVQRHVALGVLCIGVGAALQQEADGGHRGEDADGVAADGGGVARAGEVERGAPAAALGPHSDKLEHSLLHLEHLQGRRQLRLRPPPGQRPVLLQCPRPAAVLSSVAA